MTKKIINSVVPIPNMDLISDVEGLAGSRRFEETASLPSYWIAGSCQTSVLPVQGISLAKISRPTPSISWQSSLFPLLSNNAATEALWIFILRPPTPKAP